MFESRRGRKITMKLLLKIIILVLAIPVLLFAGAHIFFAYRGRALLIERLQAELQSEVSIAQARLRFPLSLEIKELEIKDVIKADYVYISPELTGLFTGKVILKDLEVLRPEFTWDSQPTDKPASGNLVAEKTSGPKQAPLLPLVINRFRVKDGRINFIDRSVSEQGLVISLSGIQLTMENLAFLLESVITNFQLEAELAGQKDSRPGKLSASGWIDFYKKDMRAELNIRGIDGVYFYPYYSYWVDLENSRIKEAWLNFNSQISSQNNDLTALCRLELADIKFRPRPPDQPEHRAEKFASAVLGIFRRIGQGRVVLDFTVKTKMDRPAFRFESISSAVDNKLSQAVQGGNIKIEDIIVLPGRFFEEMTKGTSGITRTIIEGVFSTGKTFTEALFDAFSKPPQNAKEPLDNQQIPED